MKGVDRKFVFGLTVGSLAAVGLNWLPFWWTRGAQHGDGYEVIGFPLSFRRLGGMSGTYQFRWDALALDVAVGIGLAIFVGCCLAKPRLRAAIVKAIRGSNDEPTDYEPTDAQL
jgi:hypothetical protein